MYGMDQCAQYPDPPTPNQGCHPARAVARRRGVCRAAHHEQRDPMDRCTADGNLRTADAVGIHAAAVCGAPAGGVAWAAHRGSASRCGTRQRLYRLDGWRIHHGRPFDARFYWDHGARSESAKTRTNGWRRASGNLGCFRGGVGIRTETTPSATHGCSRLLGRIHQMEDVSSIVQCILRRGKRK